MVSQCLASAMLVSDAPWLPNPILLPFAPRGAAAQVLEGGQNQWNKEERDVEVDG